MPNIEVPLYGRYELMVTKKCFIKENIEKCDCQKNKYILKSDNKEYIVSQSRCANIIMDYKIENRFYMLPELLDFGITNFRIDLYDETAKEIDSIFKEIKY